MSRREAILNATKDLLWERGYAATSPSSILEKSGSGQGSLYHFFDGKEDVAAQALREVEDEVSRRLEVTCGPGAGRGMERLERFLLAERDALRGCRLGRLAQDPELPESLRRTVAAGFRRVLAVVERAVQDAQHDGDLPAGLEAAALARALVSVVQGGYVLARAKGEKQPMAAAVNGLVALLHAAGNGGRSGRAPSQAAARASRRSRSATTGKAPRA